MSAAGCFSHGGRAIKIDTIQNSQPQSAQLTAQPLWTNRNRPVQVLAAGGDTGDNAGQRAAIAERQRLLAGALADVLTAALPAASFELDTRRQPSRLYGHGLADRMNKNAK